MKTKIIKLTCTIFYNSREEKYVTSTPVSEWINVNEIKTISERRDNVGQVFGSMVFYMAGANLIKDDRTPDELMDVINNL